MGASFVYHEVETHNINSAIRELQNEANEYHGHQEGYSGAINSIDSFREYRPGGNLTLGRIREIVDSRDVPKRCAEYINLGISHYLICKPIILEHKRGYISYNGNIIELKDIYKHYRAGNPALLINERGMTIASGKLADLKERAKKYVMSKNFDEDLFLLTSGKTYRITGEAKQVKSTVKTSSSSQLVFPVCKYVIYGYAAC